MSTASIIREGYVYNVLPFMINNHLFIGGTYNG